MVTKNKNWKKNFIQQSLSNQILYSKALIEKFEWIKVYKCISLDFRLEIWMRYEVYEASPEQRIKNILKTMDLKIKNKKLF